MQISDSHRFSKALLPADPNEVRDWIIDTGVEWFHSVKNNYNVLDHLSVSSDARLWVVPGGAGRIYETPIWGSDGMPNGMLHVELDGQHGKLSFLIDLS